MSSKKYVFGKLGAAIDEAKRETLRVKIQRIINRWCPILGVSVNEWNIREMKSYWGSCDSRAKKITFDSKLADMSPKFLEVTVVHELMHLVTKEAGHDDRFYALMDQHVPHWRKLHVKHAGRMTPKS